MGSTVHRGRGGGTRDTSEQVENRRFTLSLCPQGWRERSREAGRRRDNNEKERTRVKRVGKLIQAWGGVKVHRHVVVSEGCSNMHELRHSGNSAWLRPFVCRRHATHFHCLGSYRHVLLRLL